MHDKRVRPTFSQEGLEDRRYSMGIEVPWPTGCEVIIGTCEILKLKHTVVIRIILTACEFVA